MTEQDVERYVIKQGDCLSSIAFKNGFLLDTIWNYAGNGELKKLRKDPNILYPGDVLLIPPRAEKEYTGATEQKHRFVKKTERARLSLRLLQEGKPRANVSFIVRVGSFREKGKTDSGGFVNVEIPANATEGTLSILNKDEIIEEYKLNLGHLDPADEIAGVQKRLKNLGFDCDESGQWDEKTQAAISGFRARHKLPPGEAIDEQFTAKLKEIHGS